VIFLVMASGAHAADNYFYTAPVADFTTTAGSAWTAVPGCSLSFTPGSTTEDWLVIATGQVSGSTNGEAQAAHVRLRVEGTVEAEGGVQNDPANAETGFFMMQRITGTTAQQDIDVQAQDPFGTATTTVEQCSITAFLIPSNADFQWTEVDGASGNCPDAGATILTHTLNPTSSAGDYLSIVSFVSLEGPGGSTNKAWVDYPIAVTDAPDFNTEDAWSDARDARQTYVSMRKETVGASQQTLSVACDGSTGDSTILWAKAASFRMDAFEADYHDEDLTEITGFNSSTWTAHSTVTQTAPAASGEFIMLGTISGCTNSTASGPQHGMRFREDSTVQGDSVWGITRDCSYAEGYHNSFQWVEPYTTASAKTWDNQYQSVDNITEARFAESAIHVLQFPYPPDHMLVTATDGSATAGGTEVLNLQLVDQFGSPVLKSLSVTVSVTGSATFSANDIGGTNGSNTLNGTLSASGSGSVTITNTVAETVTVSADATGDAEVVANVDDTVTFDPGALDNFLVEAAGGGNIGTQTAAVPFNLQITAQDANNNTVTGFDGAGNTVEITSTGNLSAGGGTTATFTNGVLFSHSVTISNSGSFTITATDSAGGLGTGSENGTSNSFTVNPIGFVRSGGGPGTATGA
jgi:hypothetical protein